MLSAITAECCPPSERNGVRDGAEYAAADHATADWREEAMTHFRKAAEANFIALPSGKTKVSWDFSNPEHLVLVVRVACPVGQRAKVEQAVFRHTWRAISPAPQTGLPQS